ncbi:MAG: hypothetical protein U0414_04535 [Polyangiaceae bacterium]
MSRPLKHLAPALLVLAACSSTPSPDTASTSSSAVPTAASPSTHASAAAASASAAAPTASTPASSSTATAPSDAPAIAEVAKEPNALVLAIVVDSKSSDKDALLRVLHQSIAKVADIGIPSSKGITGNRHVTATLTLEPITETKDGYTQKAKLVGVTTDGQCPLFDLDAKATLTANPKTPHDVEDVRAAAVEQVFNKLEAQAKTLKPHGACTAEKAWK